MNIFRLAGDMTHLLSIVLLLLKIKGTRSCRGEGRRWAECIGEHAWPLGVTPPTSAPPAGAQVSR
jgi:hypothetical protein